MQMQLIVAIGTKCVPITECCCYGWCVVSCFYTSFIEKLQCKSSTNRKGERETNYSIFSEFNFDTHYYRSKRTNRLATIQICYFLIIIIIGLSMYDNV